MIIRAWRRWETSQTLLILPMIVTVVGVAGLVLGSDAARSFGNLGGSIVVRATAFVLFAGGVTILTGMARHRVLMTVIGSAIAAFGSLLYGFGTLVGFGRGGIMSGLFAIGVGLVFLERVVFAMNQARAQRLIREAQTDS